jgi:ketosteroid isomerase-like protein
MSQENLEKIRRGQEAFNRGDLSPARDIATDDVEWGSVGAFPGVERVYRGLDAMEQWMETIRMAWEWFEVSLDEVVRDAGEVIVIAERLRGRGRESGAEVEMRIFSTYWFEDGKIVKRQAFTNRKEALEAARLE